MIDQLKLKRTSKNLAKVFKKIRENDELKSVYAQQQRCWKQKSICVLPRIYHCKKMTMY